MNNKAQALLDEYKKMGLDVEDLDNEEDQADPEIEELQRKIK